MRWTIQYESLFGSRQELLLDERRVGEMARKGLLSRSRIISANGESYEFAHEGMRGRVLLQNSRAIVRASYINLLGRSRDLEFGDVHYVYESPGLFSSRMILTRMGDTVGEIVPPGALTFTRSYTADFESSVPLPVQLVAIALYQDDSDSANSAST